MGTTVKNTAPVEQPAGEPTLDEKISEALKNVDDKGKVIFEEGVDPVFKRLVTTEKSARDTKAAFTKSQQELVQLKAKAEVLENEALSSTALTPEQQEELEELKYSDPDAWRNKLNEYETSAKAQVSARIAELTSQASESAMKDLTLAQRTEALQNFQSQTGIELTDDVMQNDIPPRLQKKIDEMPFEDYLNEVATYLGKGKVVKKTEEGLEQTNLGKLPGAGEVRGQKSSSYQIL